MFSFPVACLVFALLGRGARAAHAQGRQARRVHAGAGGDPRLLRDHGQLAEAPDQGPATSPPNGRAGCRTSSSASSAWLALWWRARAARQRMSRFALPRLAAQAAWRASDGERSRRRRRRRRADASCVVIRIPESTARGRACSTVYVARAYRPRGRARVRRPAGALLHRRRSSTCPRSSSRARPTAGCCSQFLFYSTPQFIVYVVPDGDARRGAGDDRRPDAHGRADRHAGVRHQPVPRRAAAAGAGAGLERRAVPARRTRPGAREPARPRRSRTRSRTAQPQTVNRVATRTGSSIERRPHLLLRAFRRPQRQTLHGLSVFETATRPVPAGQPHCDAGSACRSTARALARPSTAGCSASAPPIESTPRAFHERSPSTLPPPNDFAALAGRHRAT